MAVAAAFLGDVALGDAVESTVDLGFDIEFVFVVADKQIDQMECLVEDLQL